MKKLSFVLPLITFVFILPIQAQNIFPNYLDGKIFVKIIDRASIQLSSPEVMLESGKPLDWLPLIQKYDIVAIHKAFPTIQSPVFDRTYEIEFNRQHLAQGLIRDLADIPYLEYAEKIPLPKIVYSPDDPDQALQYHLNNIQASQAWDIHKGGNAIVAIVDDAVKITHEDLAPNLWTNPGEIAGDSIDNDANGYIDDIHGWDPSDNDNDPNPPATATNSTFSHGTHCAGIAAGATDNGIGGASIGFNTKIMAVKCTYDNAANPSIIYAAYQGVEYAMAAGADVISMSWGGGGHSNTIQNLFDLAHAQGIVLVAAAGNSNVSSIFYPAGYNHIISVAATNSSDTKASFSNYGSWVDISAPGASIYATVAGTDSSYGYKNGTSMACPNVAGLCALLKSYNPSATPDDILICILNGADNLDTQNPNYVSTLR